MSGLISSIPDIAWFNPASLAIRQGHSAPTSHFNEQLLERYEITLSAEEFDIIIRAIRHGYARRIESNTYSVRLPNRYDTIFVAADIAGDNEVILKTALPRTKYVERAGRWVKNPMETLGGHGWYKGAKPPPLRIEEVVGAE